MAIHPFVLHNGSIHGSSEALLSPGQLGLLSGWGVFSTLRVVDGHLFAWERHWARMMRDAQLMNIPMPADSGRVEADLMELAAANSAPNCTLRLVIVRNAGGMWQGPPTGHACDVVALTADFKNWGESVRLSVQPHARYAASDFTRAKILSWSQNLTWVERAQEKGFDEVLLLNEHGRVAECTSANVFAMYGDRVITPALAEGCLPGITREVLLEIGGNVEEGTLTVEEIQKADEVFITSTTRDLLPVREVEGVSIGAGSGVREKLAGKFATFLQEDIQMRKHSVLVS